MKIYTLSWFSANSSSVLGVYSNFELAKQTMSTLLEKGEVLDLENASSYGGTTRYPILCPDNSQEYFEIRTLYLDDDEDEEEEDWDEDDDEDEDEDWDDEEEDEDEDDWDEDDDDDDDALAALQALLKRDDVEVEVELEIIIEGE